MPTFNQLLKRLFSDKATQPLIQEAFTRSAHELEQYATWKNSAEPAVLQQSVWQAFTQAQQGQFSNPLELFILKLPQANGFYFKNRAPFTNENLVLFFDFLHEKILHLPYQRYTSDRKIEEINEQIVTTEMHYLKPIQDWNSTQMMVQQFGNIQIDLVYHGRIPQYLKFTASVYSDALYQDPLEFSELMDALFKNGL